LLGGRLDEEGHKNTVLKEIPFIADKLALEWKGNAQHIAEQIRGMKK